MPGQISPELLIYVAVIQLFQIIPLLIWQYKMVASGRLRTDREMQEKVEEVKWLRAKDEAKDKQIDMLTATIADNTQVLRSFRAAAEKAAKQ